MKTDSLLHFTDDTFRSEVLESPVPVLVDFWASWCGPCVSLGPTIEELAEHYGERVKVGKLNVEEAGEKAAEYGISSIPAVLIFKDGEVVERIVGLHPRPAYEQALDRLLA